MDQVVRANAQFVPPTGTGGSFYMRPVVFGSGAGLGVGPSSNYTFVVFGSPVGAYFKPSEGSIPGISLITAPHQDRAAPQGVGHIKVSSLVATVSRSIMLTVLIVIGCWELCSMLHRAKGGESSGIVSF